MVTDPRRREPRLASAAPRVVTACAIACTLAAAAARVDAAAALTPVDVGLSASYLRDNPARPLASDSTGVRLVEVPATLRPFLRDSLLRRRARIELAIDSLNATARLFNARCQQVYDPQTLAWCQQTLTQYQADSQRIELLKLNFNEAVLVARRGSPAYNEPPPPEVVREETRFRDNPRQWLTERRQVVREAVRRNRAWTDRISRLLEAPQPPERRYEMTPLSDLWAGDIILVAPPNEQIDPSVATSNELIREVDYRYRVIMELARGRLLDAATQDRQPASHAMTFLGSIHGVRMYLSEQPGGSRMLDERAFLREYAARQIYVARPQAVVDGRRLWSAARNTAIRNPRDYGLFGDRAVCSERAGIVVARATGLNLDPDRPGPIDITPGDFFDAQGNVGKHFVITGLRITGVPQER